AQAIDQAAERLANAGYAVEAVDPPLVADIAACWRALLFTDTKVMSETAMREHGSDDFNQVLDDYVAASNIRDLDGYMRALADRTRLLRAWSVFMEDYPLVLAPVSQVPVFPQLEDLKGTARVKEMLDEQSMLYGVNVLGLPAAAVPTGLHDGIPMGVQIIGPRLREDLCLDAAEAVERGTGILTQQLWSRT
ncbi:MAG: amidase, partial [Rhodospirillaceae bacterium]|nr:amidase [Rhodospirillaceae bacterium]